MTAPRAAEADWLDANRRAVQDALATVRHHLQAHLRAAGSPVSGAAPAPTTAGPDTGLGLLRDIFGLTAFEADLLVLAAGVELDGGFAALCGTAGGDGQQPTFGLALAALPGAHWTALTPDGPLRRWRLLRPAPPRPGVPLTRAPLRLDERILHFLLGLEVADPLLAGRLAQVPAPAGELPGSHHELAATLAAAWSGGARVVQLTGADPEAATAVAGRAATLLGGALRRLAADAVPAEPADRDELAALLDRDHLLGAGPLLVQPAEPDEAGPLRLVGEIRGPVAVVTRHARDLPDSLRLEVPPPTDAEQRALWQAALPETALPETALPETALPETALPETALPETALPATPLPGIAPPDGALPDGGAGDPGVLAGQFRLGAAAIRRAAAQARLAGEDLWSAARAQARPRLDGLAQRVTSAAGWADLVLPADETAQLRDVCGQVRHRELVYGRWRLGAGSSLRGCGVSALFAGASGTGKTLAAEVLANALGLDLFRIDLSQVVSKYIGETEKNLGRVFDAADAGGAVLLFDEADALFGKRSEVKDSHDRYANIEISYLLQRMEAYRGLAILTTNLRDNLDRAFLRRLQFVVTFPFPDAAQRERLWRCALPAGVPTGELSWAALARLAVPGGVIRNIAVGAAFRAAERGGPIGMADLAYAARRECAKLERPVTDAEIGSWT